MKALLIKSCKDSMYWYANLVGTVVKLKSRPYMGEYLSTEPSGYTNIVNERDAVVIDVPEDFKGWFSK